FAGLFHGVAHRQLAALGREDHAGVAELAAGLGVERGLVDNDSDRVAGSGLVDPLVAAHDRLDYALGHLGVVAEKFGGADLVAQREPHGIGRGLAGADPRGARAGAGLLHLG